MYPLITHGTAMVYGHQSRGKQNYLDPYTTVKPKTLFLFVQGENAALSHLAEIGSPGTLTNYWRAMRHRLRRRLDRRRTSTAKTARLGKTVKGKAPKSVVRSHGGITGAQESTESPLLGQTRSTPVGVDNMFREGDAPATSPDEGIAAVEGNPRRSRSDSDKGDERHPKRVNISSPRTDS